MAVSRPAAGRRGFEQQPHGPSRLGRQGGGGL